jgi:flavin reductase (DIM6/NTAB) family NADH-FMN oxidoreductase RutF
MDKVKIDNNVFIPMPVTLIGCLLKGKANFMTAGWVSRVNANPPHIGIGIHRSHATTEGIIENNTFSVCFPDRTTILQVDYCGIVSGKDTDKSKLFTPFYGELKTAPMIEEASLNLECSLVQTSPECHENGRINPKKADYLLLTMPDNTYWTLGESIGQAWQIGRQLVNT